MEILYGILGGVALLAVYQMSRCVLDGMTWGEALERVLRPEGGGGGGPPLPP